MAAPASRDGRFSMHAAGAVVLLDGVSMGILLPSLPFVVLELGGRPVIVTQLVALYALATFFGSPILGRLSDRYGRVQVIRAALLGTCLCYLGILLSWSLAGLFGFRALAGLLAGRGGVIRAHMTDQIAVSDHAARIGWLAAATAVGATLGPAIGGLFGLFGGAPEDRFRVLLLTVAASTLATLALTVAVWRTDHRPVSRAAPTQARDPTVIRRIGFPLFYGFAVTYGYTVLMSVTALTVSAKFGWREAGTGGLLALASIIVTLSRSWLYPRLAKPLGIRRLFIICIGLAIPSLLAMAAVQSRALFVAAFAAFVLTCGTALIMPATMVSMRSAPAHRGYSLGVSDAAAALGTFFSAALNGVLFDYVAVWAPHALGAGVLAVCAIVAWVAREEATPGGVQLEVREADPRARGVGA